MDFNEAKRRAGVDKRQQNIQIVQSSLVLGALMFVGFGFLFIQMLDL
jgi:hypothetical protein